jgi:hypothetical protein
MSRRSREVHFIVSNAKKNNANDEIESGCILRFVRSLKQLICKTREIKNVQVFRDHAKSDCIELSRSGAMRRVSRRESWLRLENTRAIKR